MVETTFIIAFFAGFVSFLSPCVLSIIPGFLAYLSGTTPRIKGGRRKIFLNTVAFVAGFSLVFALLGLLLSTILSSVSYEVRIWLSRVAGIIIIIFGLYVLRLIRIPFLESEHKFKVRKFSITYITSFVFGAAFAIGWTPCVSAVLGSILALAVTSPAHSFFLLLSYALGLGIPFLIVGMFSNHVLGFMQKFRTFFKYFNIFVGALLVLLGFLIFTDNLAVAVKLLVRWLGF